MSEALMIGEYQLANLLSNRTRFIYLDLRDPSFRKTQAPGHSLLAASYAVAAGEVVSYLTSLSAPPDQPVVLICENGSKSMAAATELAQNKYINVYVVEGGTAALDLR